jgi:ribosomal protein L37AE/L43A
VSRLRKRVHDLEKQFGEGYCRGPHWSSEFSKLERCLVRTGVWQCDVCKEYYPPDQEPAAKRTVKVFVSETLWAGYLDQDQVICSCCWHRRLEKARDGWKERV